VARKRLPPDDPREWLIAVMTGYPGLAGPVTKRQHRRAVRIAEGVVRWAERLIGKP